MELWEGIVVDRDDPLQAGRVRVRIFGYHSPDINEIPNNLLPWATVLLPSTSANNSGIGETPTGLVLGSRVLGCFFDKEAQQLLVIGSIIQPHLDSDNTVGSFDGENNDGFLPVEENFPTTPTENVYTVPIPGGSPLLIDNTEKKFPRRTYKNNISTSKISTETDHTVERKQKKLEDGGHIDTEIPIAICDSEKSQIVSDENTNTSRVSFAEYNEDLLFTSNKKSIMENFSSYKKEIKNTNDKCVYTNKIKDYSDDILLQKILAKFEEFLQEYFNETQNTE